MTRSIQRSILIAGVAALALMLGTSAFAQGLTTAGINGFVIDKSGKPVDGAAITIVHVPSGTHAATVTRSGGQYTMSGLRIGGPYTVTVEAKEFQPQTEKDVYLNPGQDQTVNFTLSEEVVKMEAFVVAGIRDTTFDSAKMGASTSFDSAEIMDVPTVRRDVQDLANLDSRIGLTENTTQLEFSLSAQGQNSRFNSFLIDGVQTNDPFGLNANGFNSLRSPVPLRALAALSVDLSPYDVKYTGFTGALLNGVIKSGTNEFHGSIYGYYTGRRLRAKNPVSGEHDQLQERTQGASLGGPIIRNRLFFYLHWEDFRRVMAPPNQNFVPDASVVDQLLAAAKSFGYDPGTMSASDSISKQKTYIAKFDWNINDQQRATFTYRRTDSATPNFSSFSGSTYTSFSNKWYQARRIADSYYLTLNSQWTPDFRTDAGAQYNKYNGTAAPNGAKFPEIYVNGITGIRRDTGATVTNGQVDMGNDYSYQLNNLFTKNYTGYAYAEYSRGNHTIKFGGDANKNQYDDKFFQYYFGRYAFGSPADFAAGLANYFRYQQPVPPYTTPDTFAYYSMTDYGLVLQDTWKPTRNLTFLGGLRFDYPWFPSRPPYNGAFYDTFGFRNNTTATGNYTLAPRFGFNFELPKSALHGLFGGRRTQFRGGIGLFQGTNPAVWVANSYQTAGALNAVQLHSPGNASNYTNSTAAGTIVFNPDPLYAQSLPPPALPTPIINTTDPNFKTPTSWKANLAIDHALPWLDMVVTAEGNFLQTERGIDYKSININPVGTLPDGRIRYSGNIHSNFATVLELTNTNQGAAQSYTLALRRPMKNHWYFSASYTHTHATEVQPLTSSVATSNFNYRATIDPNAGACVNSAYVVPNKLVVAAGREFNFFNRPDALTTITAVFRMQTGHAYSWVFDRDANGDGISGNDAFYVPSGPDDPKVTWASTAQRDAFFAFVQGSNLKQYMGRIVPPNSAFNPQQQTLDLHIEQQIPLPRYNKAKLSVYLDCYNFANLLNDRWGVVTGLDFGTSYSGYNRSVAQATYNAATNQYAYTFTSSTLGGQITFANQSRWQLQVGAALEF